MSFWKSQGVTEESWDEGRNSIEAASATGGIFALIRHLLRKYHLPQGEAVELGTDRVQW